MAVFLMDQTPLGWQLLMCLLVVPPPPPPVFFCVCVHAFIEVFHGVLLLVDGFFFFYGNPCSAFSVGCSPFCPPPPLFAIFTRCSWLSCFFLLPSFFCKLGTPPPPLRKQCLV